MGLEGGIWVWKLDDDDGDGGNGGDGGDGGGDDLPLILSHIHIQWIDVNRQLKINACTDALVEKRSFGYFTFYCYLWFSLSVSMQKSNEKTVTDSRGKKDYIHDDNNTHKKTWMKMMICLMMAMYAKSVNKLWTSFTNIQNDICVSFFSSSCSCCWWSVFSYSIDNKKKTENVNTDSLEKKGTFYIIYMHHIIYNDYQLMNMLII